MNPRYPTVAARAAHRCEYCRAPEVMFNFPFEVEHIIPPSRGGSDVEANLALACRSCNLRKGVQIGAADPETRTEISLFHPRLDIWEEHFRVNVESGEIVGLTETGRATIASLDMNSTTQVAARRQWMRLDLFP